MEYVGKLYGKVGKHYFPLVETTEYIDRLKSELAQLKAEAEKEVSDEDIEKVFPTDLRILAKTIKFPEMGLSYEAKEWFEKLAESNLNKQIGAKAVRDGLIKKVK